MTPAFRDLGRQLLAREARGQSPDELAEGVERVCQELSGALVMLVGPEGVQVLFARALRLAAAEHPVLKAVEAVLTTAPSAAPESVHLNGLRESARGWDTATIGGAFAALLGNFVWLLAEFLGEDLALRKVRQTWPAVTFGGAGPGSEEADK